MKVILYMATTANGMIAKEDNNTSFVSSIEWKSFQKTISKIGNIVIGRRTYELMKADNNFSDADKTKVIVVTTNSSFKIDKANHFAVRSPKAALKLLKKYGFKEALIGGGGMLNASFMNGRLVNEIYLDIEPVAMGKGIKLFSDSNFTAKLKLVSTKKLSKNEIQLHYKVIK